VLVDSLSDGSFETIDFVLGREIERRERWWLR